MLSKMFVCGWEEEEFWREAYLLHAHNKPQWKPAEAFEDRSGSNYQAATSKLWLNVHVSPST